MAKTSSPKPPGKTTLVAVNTRLVMALRAAGYRNHVSAKVNRIIEQAIRREELTAIAEDERRCSNCERVKKLTRYNFQRITRSPVKWDGFCRVCRRAIRKMAYSARTA